MTQSVQLEEGLAPLGSSLPPTPKGETMEAARLGRLLGITPKQIERLTSLGMPHRTGVRGQLRYNTADVWAWAMSAGQQTASATGSLQDERARLARAQTERVELQNATLRRELLPWTEVKHAWHFALGNLKTRILAIPNKLAPIILTAATPAIAQEMIASALRESLEQLADVPGELRGEPGDAGPAAGADGGAAATAEADDQPVGGPEPGAQS